MSLTKLNENLNNHQSLPDQPTLSSQELKTLFDKAPNDIKTYINTILTSEIDALIYQKLDKGILNEILTVSERGDIIGNISATAGTAKKLETPRNIEISGALIGSASIDGSADVNINVTQDIVTDNLLPYIRIPRIYTYCSNMQKSGKLVHIGFGGTVLIDKSSSWQFFAVLPQNFRPSNEIRFPVCVGNTCRIAYIQPNGQMHFQYNSDDGADLVFNVSYYTN